MCGIKKKGNLKFCSNFKNEVLKIMYYDHCFQHRRNFFAPLLLTIQYLNLTIRCVSWEQLMNIMKHYAMFVCMSVCGRVYPDLYCHHSEGVLCENWKFKDNNKSVGLQCHCSDHTKCLPPQFSQSHFFSIIIVVGPYKPNPLK